uniref:Tonsoku-like protein n=1 Tax=Panagrolaimus davidi TaxID=227884 RepID=A0A914Q4K7_9BILA
MTCFNDNIKMLKERLKNRKDAKKYASAADTANELAVEYADENDNENALIYYKDALACIAKVQHKSDAVLHNEFSARRGCLESLYDEPQAKILEALNSFMEYAKCLKDPSHKQIALHVAAYTYQQYLKGEEDYLEKAKRSALASVKMLEQYGAKIDEILKKRYNNAKEFESDDSKRRLAGAYQLLASICDEEGDTKAAESYINKALEFERLESDPIFHHTILSTKRKYVSRERQYEISSKMLQLVEKMAEKEREKNMLETQAAVAEDCLVRKDFVKAGKTYWKMLSNKKCYDRELKKEAKDRLIKLYKIKERIKEVTKFEEIQPIDYRNLAKMYEKIADEMLNIGALEGAVDYYKKMKDAATLATPLSGNADPEYGDLEISRDAMLSIAETYKDLHDYEEAIRYYDKLHIIQIRLRSSASILADTRLDIAISKGQCALFSFEQQKTAFENVKMPNDKTDLYIKYLESFIEFLAKHKNNENVSSLLDDLKIELKNYKQIQIDSQDILEEPLIKSSQNDKYDLLSDNEIFAKVKKFYKFWDSVEAKKKRINVRNSKGEIDLHQAAKHSLKEVKFLIELCGGQSVINTRDYGGWTPLSEAVSHGHADIVAYLIDHGADMDILSKAELTTNDGNKCVSI